MSEITMPLLVYPTRSFKYYKPGIASTATSFAPRRGDTQKPPVHQEDNIQEFSDHIPESNYPAGNYVQQIAVLLSPTLQPNPPCN